MEDNRREEEEVIEGDPWSVLPIKTRKYAKECTEIVLSKRRLTKLINFSMFENLEALWLTDNKLTSINGLDSNFRIKILCCGNNSLTTLEGSLIKMKFLEVLFVNNNKLKNLDKVITFLRNFSFLKNLNLFGNPIAEEPEYRSRVIDALKSLETLDRHKITESERIQSEKVVKEYNDPLSKPRVKRVKRLKVYEKFSVTEKELFQEARAIGKREEEKKTEREKVQQEVIEREKYPDGYIPYNAIMSKNMEVYYNKKVAPCPELEDNEMNRLFSKYDHSKTGLFRKDDIQMLFFDIKDLLEKRGVEFNENKLINHMLDFYAKSESMITKDDIKKCYGKILHQYKSNMLKEKVLVSNLDYLKNISGLAKKESGKSTEDSTEPRRRDIFAIKCITASEKRQVVLNENKLQTAYK